mmetsp:Transcript_17610/g.48001  ORF Transcript_17610/g.48001 Transcript_17610/m.48001 type:complete len:207 (+) Transcript_17610:56-676(+)
MQLSVVVVLILCGVDVQSCRCVRAFSPFLQRMITNILPAAAVVPSGPRLAKSRTAKATAAATAGTKTTTPTAITASTKAAAATAAATKTLTRFKGLSGRTLHKVTVGSSDARGLATLFFFLKFVFDGFALRQRTESRGMNGRMMDKNIVGTIRRSDEPKALGGVVPLDKTVTLGGFGRKPGGHAGDSSATCSGSARETQGKGRSGG